MFVKRAKKTHEIVTVDVNGWPVMYSSFIKPKNAYKNPVVCLAGLFESDEALVKSLEKLTVDYPVYLVYLPGFLNNDEVGAELTYPAYSMLLNSFISMMGIEKCMLISHSYTANIAVFFADHFSDRVENLLFVSPIIQMRESIKYITSKNLDSIEEGDFETFAARESIHSMTSFSEDDSAEGRETVKNHYLNILDPKNKISEKYSAHIKRLTRFSDESVFLKGVKGSQVVVVSGNRDLLASPKETFNFSKACHYSTFVLVDQCDHLMVNQKPEVMARLYKRIFDDKPINRMVGLKVIEASDLDKKFVRVTNRYRLNKSGFIESENGDMIPITVENLSQFGCKFIIEDSVDGSVLENANSYRIHFNHLDLKVDIGLFQMDSDREYRGVFSHESFEDHEKLQSYIKELS